MPSLCVLCVPGQYGGQERAVGDGNLCAGWGSSYMKYVVNIYTTGHLKYVLFTVEDIEA